MNEGYIRLHRSIEDWEWANNPTMYYFWVRLLVVANYEDREWQGRIVERGCIITSIAKLAADFSLSVKQVRTCIERLTKSKQIVTQTANKWTKITICNYDNYQWCPETKRQTNGEQNGRQTASERATTKEVSTSSEPNGSSEDRDKNNIKIINNAPVRDGVSDSVERLYNLYPTKCPISNRRTEKGKDSKQIIARLLKSRTEENIAKLINKYLSDCIESKTYIANFATMLRKIESGKLDDLELPYEQKPETANRPKIHYYDQNDDPNYKAQ